jgi:SagB-type dehydrogenase family enzyme
MKVRRHRHLICRWEEDGLLVGVPDQRRWVKATPGLRALLDAADQWIDVDDLIEGLDESPGVRDAVDALRKMQLLTDDESAPEAETDELRAPWGWWGMTAQRFHTDARDANYLVNSPHRDETAAAIAADGNGPPAFKDYPDRPVVMLPRRPLPLHAAVDEVFAARRTHRCFTAEPVTLDQLSTVLFYTFAPQRFLDGGLFGVLQGRVSASAGARHEAECYVVVFNVVGVTPGLYHYSTRQHALELLRADVSRDELAELTYHQGPSYEGAFTCLTTAVANRLAWKYRHPRAYRLWMYDAGHYAQTFALTCTALGLGPFQTVAFADTELETFLGVDGNQEFAVYLLAAGVPDGAPAAAGVTPSLPVDFRYPAPTVLY